MAEIGWAGLGILPVFGREFTTALDKGATKHLAAAGTSGGTKFGETAGRSAGRRFGSVFSTAAKASLVGLAGAGAVAFKIGKDAVDAASDLGESVNAVNVTFGKASKGVRRLGRDAAESVGLSQTQFQGLAVQFSAFAKTVSSGSGKKVSQTLDELTTRGADFASVMNLEVNESMALFQSGLAGETEPLRKYGIDLSAAKVEAFALSEGIVKNKDDLDEAAKVQARYALLMQQTSKTQGDFANTSDSLANRQRILTARWEDAKAELGKGLLPYMEDLSGWVLDKGLPAFEDFSAWFNSKGIPAFQDFLDEAKPLAREVLPAMGETLGTVRDMLKPAAKHAGELVGFFNDMPDWAKAAIVGGGASLLVGKKLGLGALGKKAAGSLIGSAKPIPVFVVNNGVDGAVTGKAGWKSALKAGGWLAGAAVASGAGAYGTVKVQDMIEPDKAPNKAYLGGSGLTTGTSSTEELTGALKGLVGITEDAGEAADTTREKHALLRGDLTRTIKLNIDNRPVKDAIEEVRSLINLIQTANSLDVRAGGAGAAHRNKLYGDSYGGGITVTGGMNFNGVDLPAARREAEHLRRTAALGGANFE